MAAVRSGIPREIAPGVFIGATDFREFAGDVGVGWPVGITAYGGTGNTFVLDESGAGEGIVIQQVETNAAHMGIDGFDNFVGVPFEVLARGYVETAGGSGIRMRFGTGPFSLNAGNFDDSDFAIFTTFNNSVRMNGGTLIGGGGQADGQTVEINLGTPGGGFDPFYFWVRFRLEAAGANARFRLNFTFSDFDTPPAVPTVWDIDEISAGDDAALVQAVNSVLGWVRSTIGPTQISDRRISFLSFSTDPTFSTPPPLPDETFDQDASAIPPDVIIRNLQGTWVGAEGTPVELF